MASRSFPRYVEEELGKIPHFIIFAVLEWVLIIILFLDGLLAFMANEFAKFFELKIPCLICTRIDHVLVHRNPDFYYNDSICESHKKDVSCLAFCHNHRKLSDIKKMCESCLLSFATEKESDCDTYKSLVGILHKDLECFVEDDQQIQLSLKDDDGGNGVNNVEKSSTQKCSCCGKPLRAKSSYPSNRGKGFSQAPAPSPRAYPYSVSSRNEEYSRREMKVVSDSEGTEDVDGVHGGGGGGNQNHQDTKLKEDTKAASATIEGEDLHEESTKTPSTTRANKFFGIPFIDGASYNPRWSFKLNRKSPLEKTEFSADSQEGQVPYEAEDAILNHLKRHVRLDRKSLMALYMELDEERSASAVAANNAMAMITRLQAEKAAVQMEALQYQRMMEEQAEYDEEALQAASEMLIRREDEIKALETELAIYREKYGCLVEDDFKDLMSNEDQEFKFQPYLSHHHHHGGGISSPPNFINEGEDNGEKGLKFHQNVSSQVDSGGGRTGEKAYLLSRIKKLDTRSHMADNGFQFPQCSTESVNNVENGTDKASEAASITSLTDIVKALEVDSGFLELVCKEHEENTEETEILTAISENLEKLRHLVMNSPKASPKASPKTSPKGDTA